MPRDAGQVPCYRSGNQAVTALGTAAIQYQTALGGSHTGTKTVGALALQYAWLKGSFHDEILLSEQLGRADKGRRF
jgi:hypothetical protein